jgi:hypothetical protein
MPLIPVSNHTHAVHSLLGAVRALFTWSCGCWCSADQVQQASHGNARIRHQKGGHAGSPISRTRCGSLFDRISFSSTCNLLAPSPETSNFVTHVTPTYSDHGGCGELNLETSTPCALTPRALTCAHTGTAQGAGAGAGAGLLSASSPISRTHSAPILVRSGSAAKSRDPRVAFSPRPILRMQKHAQSAKKSRRVSFRQPRFCIEINTSINTRKNGRKSPPQTTSELNTCTQDSPMKAAPVTTRLFSNRRLLASTISAASNTVTRQNHDDAVLSTKAAEIQTAHAPVHIPACHEVHGVQNTKHADCAHMSMPQGDSIYLEGMGEFKFEGSTAHNMVGSAKIPGNALKGPSCSCSTENILEGDCRGSNDRGGTCKATADPGSSSSSTVRATVTASNDGGEVSVVPRHGMESAQLHVCDGRDSNPNHACQDMQTRSVMGPNIPAEDSGSEAPTTNDGTSRCKESPTQKRVRRKVPRNYHEYRLQMSQQCKKEDRVQTSQQCHAVPQIEACCVGRAQREAACTANPEVHEPIAQLCGGASVLKKVCMRTCMHVWLHKRLRYL